MAEFKLYDFDTEFSNYLQKWYEKNFGRFRTYDEMEDCVPEVYQTFLDSPAPFLNGEKPGEYFEKFDDPVLLVDWLKEYVHQDINVPDMLLNRISDLGENAAPTIVEMLEDSHEPSALLTKLRDQGRSIFFSSHELGETELLCDNVAIMKNGRCIYHGPVDRLAGDGGGNLERLFLDVLEKGGVA